MIHFDMPPQKSNIIKVLGFGGGGGNAVNHMYGQDIQNVDFIVCNTDAQALATSSVPNKIQLGPHLTGGLGAGANPSIGKQATEESLDEIRKMLEVNTKMAFITAGMGGGTGTGGAPIVAKICKELGILTVGIVTTPFGYEGPRRMAQAQAGVDQLKEHVDTLLVISNDKLRHQFGNLKMKEAFSKADDVLCIAARCITDIINTTGQINVDFSDVCTVMRDGGVAILGSAQIGGENRALEAIEAAANSPLLNDSDIRGAKWILLNITSSSGDHEATMDEIEIIQHYLREQTGEHTDVILGMGYDDTLDEKIGITLIATGFQHKDPFQKPQPKKAAEAPPIIMTLGVAGEEKKMEMPQQPFVPETPYIAPAPSIQMLMPLLNDDAATNARTPMPTEQKYIPKEKDVNLEPTLLEEKEDSKIAEDQPQVFELSIEVPENQIDMQVTKEETIDNMPSMIPPPPAVQKELFDFLHKPANVYDTHEEPKRNAPKEQTPKEREPEKEEHLQPTMHYEEKTDEANAEGLTLTLEEVPEEKPYKPPVVIEDNSMGEDMSEDEMQKRRAQERIQRLRNLSYKQQHMDNNLFDETPAYLRNNLELHNTLANVEDFYSRATVKSDDQNKGTISTLNNFLHGEKPD